jgi:hypothetical protein
MTDQVRTVAEGVARKTTRRGFFGRGVDLAFGALIGAAAGAATNGGGAEAGFSNGTYCEFPGGRPCACEYCQASGVCAKPCVIVTYWYTAGCWVDNRGTPPVTCCDCSCDGLDQTHWCGCGSDRHNDPAYCPNGNASG